MQKRSLETRSRILSTSLDLFSALGYEKTGVSLICERSSVSKGSFYHQFPSKHAVFTTLLAQWLGDLDRQFDLDFSSASDVPSGILAMTGEFGRIMMVSRPYLPLFLEFWLQSIRNPEIWQQTIAPYQNYVDRFAKIFRQGVAEGSIQPVDPDDASLALIALALGLLLQNMMIPEGRDWPSVSENVISLYLNGIKGVSNA